MKFVLLFFSFLITVIAFDLTAALSSTPNEQQTIVQEDSELAQREKELLAKKAELEKKLDEYSNIAGVDYSEGVGKGIATTYGNVLKGLLTAPGKTLKTVFSPEERRKFNEEVREYKSISNELATIINQRAKLAEQRIKISETAQ